MNENVTNNENDGENSNCVTQDDEEMRKLLKPNPTTDQVINILQRCYVHPSKTALVVVEEDNANLDEDGQKIYQNTTVRIQVLSQLDSYDDCNYHIKLNDESFLLKIHNGVESANFIQCFEKNSNNNYFKNGGSVLHYQNAIMQVLKNHNVPSNTSISAFRLSITDEPISENQILPISIHYLPVISPVHSPCRLVVRLLTWVPGRPMSSIRILPLEAIADAGRFLGRMDLALDTMTSRQASQSELSSENSDLLHLDENSWSAHLNDTSILEASRRFHQWDGKNFSSVRKYVKYIRDDKRRNMIETIMDAFDNQIASKVKENPEYFRIGVNQGDYNDANILMNEKTFQTSGVIDFGDSTERLVQNIVLESCLHSVRKS